MLTSSRTDMADNTTFHAHCEVAFYAVLFTESGVVATVSEHQTVDPIRTDVWFISTTTGERINRTF